MKIGFFGTPEYAVTTLEALHNAQFTISFVVTMPDRPQGRNLVLTPPPAKVWAHKHNIPVFQPEKLKDEEFVKNLASFDCDVFVVIAYGKILPENILKLPKAESLNIHASLLPLLRGSCPIETAILQDMKKTGVTIIHMDTDMDHGPIVASQEVTVTPWPPRASVLGKEIVEAGASLLISILPQWVSNFKAGVPHETVQDHSKATYTTKIRKEDGCINLNDDPYTNYLKIQAYDGWPSAYFFMNKGGKDIRVKITEAEYIEGKLIIKKVIPEGKKEILYSDLVR